MIEVTVHLIGSLGKDFADIDTKVALREDATAFDLCTKLKIPTTQTYMIVRTSEIITMDTPLRDQDNVSILIIDQR